MAAVEAWIPPDSDARPLVLFDLDGTLTDPADGIINCHRWALDQVGMVIDDDVDLRTVIGPPAEEAHALLGVPQDRIAESTRLYRERFAVAGWLDDAPYPGIVELVDSLAASGRRLGVATMKLEPFAVRVLERVGLAPAFDVVSGSDSARTRASKHAVIQHALDRLERGPDGVIMVGDRRHDVEAARALGITSVGVAWGFGTIEELMAAGADAIAVEPADLAQLLIG